MTIDFGEGCTGPRGITRAGKLIITHDGKIWENGSVITTVLEGYSVNGIKIEGTRTLTNLTTLESPGIVHEVKVTGGKIIWPDGTSATREVLRTRTWIRGVIEDVTDDELWIDGSASGINRREVSYTMTIDKTIVRKRSCAESGVRVPVSGVKTIVTARATISIDFGDGSCDKTAIVTKNGNSREVTLSNM